MAPKPQLAQLAPRFLRNVLLWGDPETSKGDMAPELLELQKQAQAAAGTSFVVTVNTKKIRSSRPDSLGYPVFLAVLMCGGCFLICALFCSLSVGIFLFPVCLFFLVLIIVLSSWHVFLSSMFTLLDRLSFCHTRLLSCCSNHHQKRGFGKIRPKTKPPCTFHQGIMVERPLPRGTALLGSSEALNF